MTSSPISRIERLRSCLAPASGSSRWLAVGSRKRLPIGVLDAYMLFYPASSRALRLIVVEHASNKGKVTESRQAPLKDDAGRLYVVPHHLSACYGNMSCLCVV